MEASQPVALDGVRVLVVANEQVGERMAGPAIRAVNLAQQLAARGASVTLAAPKEPSTVPAFSEAGRIAYAAFGTPAPRRFTELARAHDVVFSQPQRVDIAVALQRARTPVIYDLYVPSFVERIAQLASEPMPDALKRRLLERDRLEYAAAVRLGDAFVCASEQQKDHWLGALGQAGRLDVSLAGAHARADDLLVAVAPFGVSDAPPAPLAPGEGALRGVLVEPDAVALLWTGGLWNWFDPVTLVEGLAAAREREPRLQLVVMGAHHPEAAWVEQAASVAMRERADELGLLEGGRAAGVVLCPEWIAYDERRRYLLDADAGVSAHHPGLETRLSFRTRLLDHLWAGLPTITTRGGELSERMVVAGAALEVAPGSVDGWREALTRLARLSHLARAAGDTADTTDGLDSMRAAARELADDYRWSRTSEPLARIVADLARSGRGSRGSRGVRGVRGSSASPPAPPTPASFGSRARLLTLRERVAYVSLLLRIRAQAKGIGSIAAAVRGALGR